MSCSPQHERSPLYVAAKKGHTDVVDVLVTHGANTNTLDSVRNLMDTHMCFKFVFIILSNATILDDVHM